MKVIDLLNKIENKEMEEAIFYVNGDFFYDLIVIDKNLYVINTIAKKLELLESKYISRFIKNNVELIRLDTFEEIIEDTPKVQVEMTQKEYMEYLDRKLDTPKEDKKIKRIQSCGDNLYSEYIGEWLVHKENYSEYDELLMNKINEIIDRLNGEDNE